MAPGHLWDPSDYSSALNQAWAGQIFTPQVLPMEDHNGESQYCHAAALLPLLPHSPASRLSWKQARCFSSHLGDESELHFPGERETQRGLEGGQGEGRREEPGRSWIQQGFSEWMSASPTRTQQGCACLQLRLDGIFMSTEQQYITMGMGLIEQPVISAAKWVIGSRRRYRRRR